MSEMLGLIEDTAGKIMSDLCAKDLVDEAEQGSWPETLWQTLEESRLTVAVVPEDQGGGGGSLEDGMAVLAQAGRHAAPLPLAETLLAGWALAGSGCGVPSGPLTLAPIHPNESLAIEKKSNGSWVLSGTARRVPWAARAARIVVLASHGETLMVTCVEPGACAITPGKNLAGEPRDDVLFDAVELPDGSVSAAGDGIDAAALRRLGALTRSVLMAGALETVLQLSIELARVRVKFGRPIGSFQAIRQNLAVFAGQVAAANKAAEVAVRALEAGDARIEIAAAKARAGEAAGKGAEIGHQTHGAMGVTHEHALHQYTRRLWSWRDEFGPEMEWQAEIGRAVAQRGPENLWAFITNT